MPTPNNPPSTAIRPTTAPTGRPVAAAPNTQVAGLRAQVSKSRLGKLNTVQARDKGNWFQPGNYRVELSDVYEAETREPECAPYFMVKCKVLANGNSQGETPAGMDGAWMTKLTKDGADRDVKGFLDAALTPDELEKLNSDDDAIRIPFIDSIVHVLNGPSPLAGRHLLLNVSAKPIKKTPGKFFNVHRWYPVLPSDETT